MAGTQTVWFVHKNFTYFLSERVLIMKKTFKLVDLDCANCAAKMEDAINKLPEVKSATVSFMTQKLTVEADDVDAVMDAVVKCIAKVEPDCEVVLK
jgi:copper chaperone CopZ